MALNIKSLSRFHETHMTANAHICWFKYATNDTQAEVVTAAYFNNARESLRVGDIIEAIVDADGAPAFVRVRVTAVATGADVTTAVLA
ncbi:hypothetical protein [Roseibium album]|uniref:hypothetical protein n=1 Tax=Roseibium album TaxID=311410 RepID=UPI002492021F|nr:hypothetical protein [Roseibium album]